MGLVLVYQLSLLLPILSKRRKLFQTTIYLALTNRSFFSQGKIFYMFDLWTLRTSHANSFCGLWSFFCIVLVVCEHVRAIILEIYEERFVVPQIKIAMASQNSDALLSHWRTRSFSSVMATHLLHFYRNKLIYRFLFYF